MSCYGFYISGKSERLKKFIKQTDSKKLESVKIIVAENELESELKQLLEIRKIPYKIVLYHTLGDTNVKRNEELSNRILKELDRYQVDYCFVLGKHLLSGELLIRYRNKIINFHPSLLPMYPGFNAIDQAVNEGKVFLIGNTAHFINEGVDAGPIIMQSVIPMQAFMDTKDYDKILDLQIEMLNQLMEIIDEGRLLVIDGKVRIKDADYAQGTIYPVRGK